MEALGHGSARRGQLGSVGDEKTCRASSVEVTGGDRSAALDVVDWKSSEDAADVLRGQQANSCFVEEECLEVGGGSSDWYGCVDESPEEGGVRAVLLCRISMREVQCFTEASLDCQWPSWRGDGGGTTIVGTCDEVNDRSFMWN